MQKYYDLSVRQKCVICGIEKNVPDLWEPRWQWEMRGLLCKPCFDKKEEDFNKLKNFCSVCGMKLGIIRYNPKKHWPMKGQICRNCWDTQKAKSDS
jgi:ribosomal protein S14